ncbi:hypothetical protein ACE193_21220 [Bernardetia sp. OM2101]|uniref:hypothetical protein n=1 Tax=Bernardetia sp. OM2101 TaxID=3344876 RepID=UPI0035D06B9E
MDTQKTQSPLNANRRWYDKKRFVLLLLFFFFPVGLYFLWKSNAFSKEGKIGLSIGFGLFFFMYVAGVLIEPKEQNNQVVDNNLPDRVDMVAEEGTVQYNNNGEVVGRTEEKKEKAVEVSMTVISKDFIGKEKAAIDIRLSDRASIEQLTAMANAMKEKYPDYKRYFIGYYLPNDKVGTGYWATTHFDPDLYVNRIGLSLTEYEEMINRNIKYKGTKIIKWFEESGKLSSLRVISKLDNSKYILTEEYSDGSSSEKPIQKKGDKYIYKNDFGEYYKIEKDGKLGWYTKEERFFLYEPIEEENKNNSVGKDIANSENPKKEMTDLERARLIQENPKTQWALKLVQGEKWDFNKITNKLGNDYEVIQPTKLNPNIVKGYYFKDANVTLFTNTLKNTFYFSRIGRESE